ncbi:MAG TPA: division/cell wall cluster transcriptional repressor MraZ, partial [Geothermobacteraceae bacterium]|nr:division/cell wall cluster transcriptional repressor MraZ [Geothermobacteraceae bacterium]
MINFQGKFYNAIDAKGRASIPARFRDELERAFGDSQLVVTEDKSGVVAYPLPVWKEILAKIEQLPPGQFRDDLYLTTVSPASECSFDKQGRIQLSQSMREHAGLVGDVREFVAIGVAKKILLMGREQHAQSRAQAQDRLDDNPQSR